MDTHKKPPTPQESSHGSLVELENTLSYHGSSPPPLQKPLIDDLIRIPGFCINQRLLDEQSRDLLLANSFGLDNISNDDRVVLALLTISYARHSLNQVWPDDKTDSKEAKKTALNAVGDFLIRQEKPYLRKDIISKYPSEAVGKVLSILQNTRCYLPIDRIPNQIYRTLAWYVTGIRHYRSRMPGRFSKGQRETNDQPFWGVGRFKGRQRQAMRNALFTKALTELNKRGLPFLVPWKAFQRKGETRTVSIRADVYNALDVPNDWPTSSTSDFERSQVVTHIGTQQIPWFDAATQQEAIIHIAYHNTPQIDHAASLTAKGLIPNGLVSVDTLDATGDNDTKHGRPRTPSLNTGYRISLPAEPRHNIILQLPTHDHRIVSGMTASQGHRRLAAIPSVTTGCDIFLHKPTQETMTVRLPTNQRYEVIQSQALNSVNNAVSQLQVSQIMVIQEKPPQELLLRGLKRKFDGETYEKFSAWKKRVIRYPDNTQPQSNRRSSSSHTDLYTSRKICPVPKSNVSSSENWSESEVISTDGKLRMLDEQEDRKSKLKGLTEQAQDLEAQRIRIAEFSNQVRHHQHMMEAHRQLLSQHEEMMVESAALMAVQGKLLSHHNKRLNRWEDRLREFED